MCRVRCHSASSASPGSIATRYNRLRQGGNSMATTRGVTRRTILTRTAGLLAAPAIVGRAYAATRGVTDTQITFGTMQDLSGVTAVQGVNNANAMRMVYD